MKATTQAIVLRRIRWSESSLILTLYSLDLGRISVMAKGALRAKSPFSGKLELFSRIEVTLSRKPGRELDTLTDVSVLDHGGPLRVDPAAFGHSCLMAEWMLGVITGSEASHPTFHLLKTVLEQFASGPPFWPVLCSGVERLLRFSGLGMEVERCTRCGGDASVSLRWNPLAGGIVCSSCMMDETEVPGGFLEFVRRSRSGSLEKAKSLNLWKGGFRQSMEIMRGFAEAHLNARLKLKSLSVLEDLENE
jgi:DNA repair protein RecO (recombination protein O)